MDGLETSFEATLKAHFVSLKSTLWKSVFFENAHYDLFVETCVKTVKMC